MQASATPKSASAPRSRKGRGLVDIVAFIERAAEVARQRRALLRLGDSALKDFGASRADAWNEARRAWWDLPRKDA